ncbi:hypothetical protein PYCC9005_003949 [Savitreella phatthalungensis]
MDAEPPSYSNAWDESAAVQARNRALGRCLEQQAKSDSLPEYDCSLLHYGTVLRKLESYVDQENKIREPFRRPWQDCFAVLRGTKLDLYVVPPGSFAATLSRSTTPGLRKALAKTLTGYDDAFGSDRPGFHHLEETTVYSEHERRLSRRSSELPSTHPLASRERSASVATFSEPPSFGCGQATPFRTFSLLGAAAGVAADYAKKPNVLRVRCEDEQFLLQCRNSRGVVSWLDAINQGRDLAEPLETRREPRAVINPRRRVQPSRAQLHEVFEAERPEDDLRRRTFYTISQEMQNQAPGAGPLRLALGPRQQSGSSTRRVSRTSSSNDSGQPRRPRRAAVTTPSTLTLVTFHIPDPLTVASSSQNSRSTSDDDDESDHREMPSWFSHTQQAAANVMSSGSAMKRDIWAPEHSKKAERFVCAILNNNDKRHTPLSRGRWVAEPGNAVSRTLVVA